MFCNIKVLFFIIVYLMSMLLYCFFGKQLLLVGIVPGFALGSIVTFGIIVVSCFVVSLVLSFLFKCSYMACCLIFKIEKAGLSAFSRSFWIIFTGLIYLMILIIFLKVTEY
jgi:hypothetical protein